MRALVLVNGRAGLSFTFFRIFGPFLDVYPFVQILESVCQVVFQENILLGL